ncbi:MAG: class I SAM-dependent methyltransferase [Candidatus Methanofastidiosum sp.]|nr:class I SAM-dependent methyltransferase [Methanofastidiosum sp.]
MRTYVNYTGYTQIVALKKLDFIINSIREFFEDYERSEIKGLDVGCGKGDVTIPLSYLGYKMVGIDISPDNIKVANSKRVKDYNPQFFVVDAEKMTLKEKFDFVICSEVLEHLKDPQRALSSIHSVLKKNGLLIVTVPNGLGPYSLIFDHFRNKVISKIFSIKASDHIQTFTLSDISHLLELCGFKILEIQHSDFISFLLFGRFDPLQKFDCKLADKLPSILVSGWYFKCRKI